MKTVLMNVLDEEDEKSNLVKKLYRARLIKYFYLICMSEGDVNQELSGPCPRQKSMIELLTSLSSKSRNERI